MAVTNAPLKNVKFMISIPVDLYKTIFVELVRVFENRVLREIFGPKR